MASPQFGGLLKSIEGELHPEPEWVVEAHRRALKLIDELHKIEHAWMFEVEDAVPHGSHVRETAIYGFKDVDYLVVLNGDALRTIGGKMRSASDTVQRLARVLRQRRSGLVSQGSIQVRVQEHSVGVKYPGSRFGVDLVPALRTDERGCYAIPNRLADEWVETRPHRLKRRITLAEQKNPSVRAAIRLIKGWRRARGKAMRFPSYAIELVLGEWAAIEPTLEGLVRLFFAQLASADARQRLVLLGEGDRTSVTVRDPWSGVNVTEELDLYHRGRLVENARRALEELDEAQALLADGGARGALGVLRRLFKGSYK